MTLMDRREGEQRLRGTQTSKGVKTECRRQVVLSFNSLSEGKSSCLRVCV